MSYVIFITLMASDNPDQCPNMAKTKPKTKINLTFWDRISRYVSVYLCNVEYKMSEIQWNFWSVSIRDESRISRTRFTNLVMSGFRKCFLKTRMKKWKKKFIRGMSLPLLIKLLHFLCCLFDFIRHSQKIISLNIQNTDLWQYFKFLKAKADHTRILSSFFPNSSCAVDVSSKVSNDLVSLKVTTSIALCHS